MQKGVQLHRALTRGSPVHLDGAAPPDPHVAPKLWSWIRQWWVEVSLHTAGLRLL